MKPESPAAAAAAAARHQRVNFIYSPASARKRSITQAAILMPFRCALYEYTARVNQVVGTISKIRIKQGEAAAAGRLRAVKTNEQLPAAAANGEACRELT